MHRRLIQEFLTAATVTLLAACASKLAPVPATDTPAAQPPTTTPSPITAPIVEAPTLVAIHMFDAANGWGVSEGAVLRTVDGGVNWHDVSPLTAEFGYAATTAFLDERRGWVLLANPDDWFSGILYRTDDGGAAWNESPVPFGGGSLRFVDSRHGWMMASLGAGAGSMAVAIYQTDDSGATWSRTYVNDPNQAGAAQSLPLGGLKDGITPVSMERAWLGGVVYEPGRIYLYETSDGGRTWSQSPVTAPAGYEEAELETTGPIFADAQTAFLPLHMSSQNGVMLATYISQDGGSSWLLGPEFIPQGGSVDFVTPDVGFVWNGQVFYVTSDGATSWTAITPDVDFRDSFGGMDFVSPQLGFVLSHEPDGSVLLYVTSDSGATWDLVGDAIAK